MRDLTRHGPLAWRIPSTIRTSIPSAIRRAMPVTMPVTISITILITFPITIPIFKSVAILAQALFASLLSRVPLGRSPRTHSYGGCLVGSFVRRAVAKMRGAARRTSDGKPEAPVTGTRGVDASSKTTGHQGPRCAPSYRTAPGRSGSRPRGER